MQSTITTPPVVLSPEMISALPQEPLGTIPGVAHRVVWRDGLSMAGVMSIDAGHRLGVHAHRAHHHHIWMVEGAATILGVELSAGSYVHIPQGVDHDIDARTTGGCVVFYLYLRQAE